MTWSLLFVIPVSVLISYMSYCMLSTSPPYLLLDSPPTVGIREHPVLNSLEVEWGVQQHPHGENTIEAVNMMSEMMLVCRILQCRNDVDVVAWGVWVVRHGSMAVWRHSENVSIKQIEWFVFPSWWPSSRVTGMKCKEERCVKDVKRSCWWPTGKWCVFVFVICKERSVKTNGSSLVVIVCWQIGVVQ